MHDQGVEIGIPVYLDLRQQLLGGGWTVSIEETVPVAGGSHLTMGRLTPICLHGIDFLRAQGNQLHVGYTAPRGGGARVCRRVLFDVEELSPPGCFFYKFF